MWEVLPAPQVFGWGKVNMGKSPVSIYKIFTNITLTNEDTNTPINQWKCAYYSILNIIVSSFIRHLNSHRSFWLLGRQTLLCYKLGFHFNFWTLNVQKHTCVRQSPRVSYITHCETWNIPNCFQNGWLRVSHITWGRLICYLHKIFDRYNRSLKPHLCGVISFKDIYKCMCSLYYAILVKATCI